MSQYWYKCKECGKEIKRNPNLKYELLCAKCKTKQRMRTCIKCGKQFNPHSIKGKRGDAALYCSNKCAPHDHLKGRTVSKETREKLSKAAWNNKGGRTKYFKIWCAYLQKEISVQGTYELKYAQYLNEQKIRWTRDKTINLSYQDNNEIKRTYYPDFYLIDSQEYIETKGYFYPEDIIKMQIVKEQHYDKQIKILFYEDLRKLGISI